MPAYTLQAQSSQLTLSVVKRMNTKFALVGGVNQCLFNMKNHQFGLHFGIMMTITIKDFHFQGSN